MARVVLEKLTKVFKGPQGQCVRAVDQVDLTVEDKELLVLLGPSGCGKTTLLRLVAGVEDLCHGNVLIDGKLMNHVEPRDRDVAMVFQKDALYPHLNVAQNIGFGLKLRKHGPVEIDRRVKEVAERLQLSDWLERKPHELSGGQRQRVALGRAIVRQPKVFLLDEPLSNLDRPMRSQMRAEIVKLHRELGATMIYVTHDQAEAMTLGDRIAVMKAGRIQQVDTALGVYERPGNVFVADFMGSHSMNLFSGRVAQRDGELVFEEKTPSAGMEAIRVKLGTEASLRLKEYSGKEIVLGLRAEDLVVSLNAQAATGRLLVQARVDLVEPIGSTTYIHASTPAHSLVARAEPLQRIALDEKISLKFDIGQAHFFDPASGSRIECGTRTGG